MNLYFYGGSFDPPHLGHKEIVNYFINKSDKFLIVPSYHSPLKNYKPIMFSHREKMLKIMFNYLSEKLIISDFEVLNKTLFTIDTIKYLQKEYPSYNKHMIIGADQYNKISKWKAYKYILNNVNLSVVSRPKYKVNIKNEKIQFINDIQVNISSTAIRENINKIDNVKSIVDENVLEYILKNKLYI